MLCGTRIAIFHDDSEIAANIAKLAGEADLAVVQPASSAALEAELSDPLVAAVVIDLMGPRNGGFELLERVANAPARPQVIIVTALDTETIDSLQRFGRMKELNLRVFRKDDDTNLLRSCLIELEKREARFTAAHMEDAVEALCRLRHPHFGNVYPEQFIAIAERHGLIDKITDSVVCHAFRDLGLWRDQGFAVRLALNISPVLLKTGEWCKQFISRCQEFG